MRRGSKSERTAPFRVVRDPEIRAHSAFQSCARSRNWRAQRVSALCRDQKMERAEIIEISSLGWRPRAQPIYHARKNLYSVVKDHSPRLPAGTLRASCSNTEQVRQSLSFPINAKRAAIFGGRPS